MQKRKYYLISILALVAFISINLNYSRQVETRESIVIKIDKTENVTEILAQHKEIPIHAELVNSYISILDISGISNLKALGIDYKVLDYSGKEADGYFILTLKDIKNLGLLEEKGEAIWIEQNRVLFRPYEYKNPREILPDIIRGIKRLDKEVKIDISPAYKEYWGSIATTAAPDPVIDKMAQSVSQTNLKNRIQDLQDFKTRFTTTSKCEEAGQYLYEKLSEITNISVEYDPFKFYGYDTRNIVGTLKGTTDPGSIVVISAHYDSYTSRTAATDAPGADDNASGCAAVLEAARIMSKYSFRYTIKFVLFSAEEWGLYGSVHYASEARNKNQTILGVVNMDMISYADKLPEDLDVIVNKNSAWLGPVIENAAANYSSIDVTTTLDNSFDYSDHSSFWDEGYPAALCIEDYEDTNPYYHTTSDKVDKIDMNFATESTKVCLAATAVLAQPEKTQGTIELLLNRTALNFGATTTGICTASQDVWISGNPSETFAWTISESASWLSCSPTTGNNAGIFHVTVNPSGLTAGNYTTEITIASPDASNSPRTVKVNLTVKSFSQTGNPFGEFSTPEGGATVNGSIPVTGWALDDIGIKDVKLYRAEGDSLVYIGDGVFVEDARPDVEGLYSAIPNNYKSGWGYMLLTNFFPGQGNGTYTLYAIATDIEGHSISLGSKIINVNNANAVNPFGAIETPLQGGTASGKEYINWGWALTPKPNKIPTNGGTISVWVDGILKGHPHYNLYRSDIAELFPGYSNSNGAVGYYTLDTTAYENGVHTIYWTAEDNGGNSGGIGSRFFTVFNSTASNSRDSFSDETVTMLQKSQLKYIQIDSSPILYEEGYALNKECKQLNMNELNRFTIESKELERIEIHLSRDKEEKSVCENRGYLISGEILKPLPPGSTFDKKENIFYWQPGPGFSGKYEFVFIRKDENGKEMIRYIDVKINPYSTDKLIDR